MVYTCLLYYTITHILYSISLYRFMMGEGSPVMCTQLTKLALVVMVKKGESDRGHLLLSKVQLHTHARMHTHTHAH